MARMLQDAELERILGADKVITFGTFGKSMQIVKGDIYLEIEIRSGCLLIEAYILGKRRIGSNDIF